VIVRDTCREAAYSFSPFDLRVVHRLIEYVQQCIDFTLNHHIWVKSCGCNRVKIDERYHASFNRIESLFDATELSIHHLSAFNDSENLDLPIVANRI
jgi:hypothetical protein